MTATSPGAQPIRQDIQALRALAVLLVLAHHFSIASVKAGFLGVDIFFVVSGYLMGRMIVQGCAQEGGFRFGEFYARRLKRLAPAAVATTAVTLVASLFLLDPYEQRDLWFQAAGVLTLSSNIVLWGQTDYFSSGGALKPLLHFWSLALEEQFYLLLPIGLVLAPRPVRMPLVAAATAGSLLLCLILVSRSPSATFYFLPTRAWEPGLGVLLALWLEQRPGHGRPGPWGNAGVVRLARAIAWALLLAVPLLASEAGHPGLAALTVCIATLVILLPGQSDLPPALRFVQAIGDRSYSLYLVHWPPLALLANVYVDQPPGAAILVAALATVVLCEIQYRLVETPFRSRTVPLMRVMLFPAGLAILLLAIPEPGRNQALSAASREANMGLGYDCTAHERFVPRPQCRSRPEPEILVWGDSLAMHLVPGLARGGQRGVLQATRWVCGPILGIAPVNQAYSKAWARSCLDWNQSVLDALALAPSVKVVVLSSILSPYVEAGEPGWSALRDGQMASGAQPRDNAQLLAALSRTVAAIRSKGRRVVLVAPVPSADYDVGRCLVRQDAGLITLGRGRDCTLHQADSERRNAGVRRFIGEVERLDIVPVIDPAEAMCEQGRCTTRQGDVSLYRDAVHLSRAGSQWLERRMDLERSIWMKAR